MLITKSGILLISSGTESLSVPDCRSGIERRSLCPLFVHMNLHAGVQAGRAPDLLFPKQETALLNQHLLDPHLKVKAKSKCNC